MEKKSSREVSDLEEKTRNTPVEEKHKTTTKYKPSSDRIKALEKAYKAKKNTDVPSVD